MRQILLFIVVGKHSGWFCSTQCHMRLPYCAIAQLRNHAGTSGYAKDSCSYACLKLNW